MEPNELDFELQASPTFLPNYNPVFLSELKLDQLYAPTRQVSLKSQSFLIAVANY